jgi:hypothetical protein
MIKDEDISFWDDKPVGVSGGIGSNELNKKYEDRRQERVIGLACYGTLIDLQNFLKYSEVYSWPEGSEEMVAQMQVVATKCLLAMKEVETTLLGINSAFYAPIIPTEESHKLRDKNSME